MNVGEDVLYVTPGGGCGCSVIHDPRTVQLPAGAEADRSGSPTHAPAAQLQVKCSERVSQPWEWEAALLPRRSPPVSLRICATCLPACLPASPLAGRRPPRPRPLPRTSWDRQTRVWKPRRPFDVRGRNGVSANFLAIVRLASLTQKKRLPTFEAGRRDQGKSHHHDHY